MAEPRWVERLIVDAVHLDQLREHSYDPFFDDLRVAEPGMA
jgi:hypothetical protein